MTSPSSASVASQDTEHALSEKMRDIDRHRQEKQAQELAAQHRLGYLSLAHFPIAPEVLGKIDEETARREQVVCFFHEDNQIRLGTPNPLNPNLPAIIQKLEKEEAAEIKLFVISPDSLRHALELYRTIPKIHTVKSAVDITQEDFQKTLSEIHHLEDVRRAVQNTNTSRALSTLLSGAVNLSASDIHIEAEESGTKIRYRIDGVLHDVAEISPKERLRLIARIKTLSNLKLNIEDAPQDGNLLLTVNKEEYNLRVSTLPTAHGESVVMRILRNNVDSVTLEDLGLRPSALQVLNEEIHRSAGMVITTGPTGSGKTTTLYAILLKLRSPENKIITLEDPIEYRIEGISQSEVHEDRQTTITSTGERQQIETPHHYSFAKGLRSILRQDPDMIMVGEIRDAETADTAIQAALTGHLVLSTLHTNDASGAIPRFLSMGIQPFLLAPALNAIIGQRLVRKLCSHCKKPASLSAEQQKKVEDILKGIPQTSPEFALAQKKPWIFYTAQGCEQCNHLGYKGRVGIYEIFAVDEEMEKSILSGAVSESDLKALATQRGMITLLQDGVLKALEGLTSVEEVLRVAG